MKIIPIAAPYSSLTASNRMKIHPRGGMRRADFLNSKGFSSRHYFIHEGWLPGYADSHGCVRLRYEDARLIFHRIRVGDPVRVRQRGVARAADPWPSVFPVF
ncbi:L,D-transpeptidase, partial [Thiococcus pfennigii]|uniref:L,D-transpeptidase n=1 Tax=Thiococcus pfennigii TaxID=1057 RepID=UPI001F5BFE92